MRIFFSILALSLLMMASSARADEGCTLLLSYPEARTLHEEGDCGQRRSPASTFKIALAVMGFDSGILKDPHTPALPYLEEYARPAREQETTDPAIWLKDSIVWYSQHLTRELGMGRFQSYVDRFAYGNRDLSGNPGRNDGLTEAWLVSSLRISPAEQAQFLEKLLKRNLGVSQHAYDMTFASMPAFAAGDWIVHGKTGSGSLYKADGAPDPQKPAGWFVGWAEKGARKIIFVKFLPGVENDPEPMGYKTRNALLAELPALAGP